MFMPVRKLPVFIAILPLLLFVSSGCQRRDEVQTQTKERTSPPQEPIDADRYLQQLDHILVAIVPQEEKVWFFKLTGKAEQIEAQRKTFLEFVKSIKPSESADDLPTWELPEGWENKESTVRMRLATITVPDENGSLEIAVSNLPASDNWEAFVDVNVNRWLGQLSRRPLVTSAIMKLAEEQPFDGGTATVFQLSGKLQAAPMQNPHANLAPKSKEKETESEVPQGPLVYQTPEGWKPGRTTAMRKAAFLISNSDKQAEVTVIDFPANAGPQITDVSANMLRWAGQVGLNDLGEEGLAKILKKIEIDGKEASYGEFLSPEGVSPGKGLLGAMVEHGDRIWFFKMIGDRDVVESEQEKFQEFLKTVEFQ